MILNKLSHIDKSGKADVVVLPDLFWARFNLEIPNHKCIVLAMFMTYVSKMHPLAILTIKENLQLEMFPDMFFSATEQ